MSVNCKLLVCTTCASVWQDGQKVGISGGERLFDRLADLSTEQDDETGFSIVPVSCMSACQQSCTVSFGGENKYSYLFGKLSPDMSDAELCQVLECAATYSDRPDGNLPWSERPPILKSNLLAKIPPLNICISPR
jgi:predicted metal-binding protein